VSRLLAAPCLRPHKLNKLTLKVGALGAQLRQRLGGRAALSGVGGLQGGQLCAQLVHRLGCGTKLILRSGKYRVAACQGPLGGAGRRSLPAAAAAAAGGRLQKRGAHLRHAVASLCRLLAEFSQIALLQARRGVSLRLAAPR
jgi:hypothetical protein